MSELIQGFKRGAVGTLKYGYFAPLTAGYFAVTRKGNYFGHIRALYRLCFGRGRLTK